MEKFLALGGKAMQIFTLLAFIAGGAWFVAKPRAEEFIKETVKDRLGTLEQSAADIQKQQKEQDQSNVDIKTDLASVKASQRDMQDSLRIIIQNLINEPHQR